MTSTGQRADERDIVRSAVMVDVIGAKCAASDLLQQIRFFVGNAGGPDDADAGTAAFIAS
jgi:hypothetical protein